MSAPSVQRSDRSGTVRPAPRINRWSPIALARRRALSVAVAEAEAAWLRNDPPSVTHAWRELVAVLNAALGDGADA